MVRIGRYTLLMGLTLLLGSMVASGSIRGEERRRIALPEPRDPGTTLAEAFRERRSVRTYRAGPLTLDEISLILWAAQGITDPARGFRTAPSAGATFPLEVYLAVGDGGQQEKVPPGLYRYVPGRHALELLRTGDVRRDLYRAALRQDSVRSAPMVVILTGVTARTSGRYGARAERYIAMEAGHVSQNIYLQATALGLGTVAIGAFQDATVARILDLPSGENPLYLMPLGRR